MMRSFLPAALLAALSLYLAPASVHAQGEGGEQNCMDGYTWADSYLYADSSGGLSGYSTTYNLCSDYYISVAVDATIYDPNGNAIAGDSDEEYCNGYDATVDLSATATSAGDYSIQGYHYLCFYDASWEAADPPWTYEYVWSAGSVSPYAPTVTSVSVSGSPVRGGSGSATIAGTYLAICNAQTSVSIDGGVSTTVTSEDCGNPTQLGIGYSIPASTTSGSHQLTIGTVYGVGHGTFTVDDPTPAITSISPSTWTAGGEQSFTISGSYFGSGPSFTITGDAGDYIGSYGLSSSSDTSISAFVDLTYSSGGSATVTVQSYGYGGNGFMEGSGGGSPTSQSASATISNPPSSMVVVKDWTAYSGNVLIRQVQYQVKLLSGAAAGSVWMCESATVQNWSCTNASQPTPTTNVCPTKPTRTDSNGLFIDEWTLSWGGYTPAGCGYSTVDTWSWLDSSGNTHPLGVLSGFIDTNAISIDNVVCPSDNPNCGMTKGTKIPQQ